MVIIQPQNGRRGKETLTHRLMDFSKCSELYADPTEGEQHNF